MACVSNRAILNLLEIKCKSKAEMRLSYMNAGTHLERENINYYCLNIYLPTYKAYSKAQFSHNFRSTTKKFLSLKLVLMPQKQIFPHCAGGRNIFNDTNSTQKIQNLVLSVRPVPEG